MVYLDSSDGSSDSDASSPQKEKVYLIGGTFAYLDRQLSLRYVVVDQVPYFVAADLAKHLNYTYVQGAVHRHVKKEYITDIGTLLCNKERAGEWHGLSNMTRMLTDIGALEFILSTNGPGAKDIQAWMYKVVFPQIINGKRNTSDTTAKRNNTLEGTTTKRNTTLEDTNSMLTKALVEQNSLHLQKHTILCDQVMEMNKTFIEFMEGTLKLVAVMPQKASLIHKFVALRMSDTEFLFLCNQKRTMKYAIRKERVRRKDLAVYHVIENCPNAKNLLNRLKELLGPHILKSQSRGNFIVLKDPVDMMHYINVAQTHPKLSKFYEYQPKPLECLLPTPET